MPIKIFTTIDGPCPFGTGHAIDSTGCRKCDWYFRQGTGTFFWCGHPAELMKKLEKPKERPVIIKEQSKKRGRPKKNEPANQKKKRGTTPKKGKERPIKAIKQKIK